MYPSLALSILLGSQVPATTPKDSESTPNKSSTSAPATTNQPKATFVDGWWKDKSEILPMRTSWGAGITAGFTSGLGLSLRKHFESGFGLHLGGFGIWTRDLRHVNLSLQALYTFHRTRMVRFYAIGGVMWMVNQNPEYVPAPEGVEGSQRRHSTSHRVLFGPGAGAELFMHRRFSMSLELPLVFTIGDVGASAPPLEDRLGIFPGVNASIHMYFR